jgi:hypothetical protein
MAVTKTQANVIGTSGSKQNITGGSSYTSSSRNPSAALELKLLVAIAYGSSVPGSDPLVEVFTSDDDSTFDSEPLDFFYMPRTVSVTKVKSVSLRNAGGIKYYKVKVTNGATNAIDVWVSEIATTI